MDFKTFTWKRKWYGIIQGRELFKIESGTYTYGLRILDKTITPGPKSITERSFDNAAKKAEKILENYLKSLKKKKNEVSQNNSTGR